MCPIGLGPRLISPARNGEFRPSVPDIGVAVLGIEWFVVELDKGVYVELLAGVNGVRV